MLFHVAYRLVEMVQTSRNCIELPVLLIQSLLQIENVMLDLALFFALTLSLR